jgi:hypothetical protein
MEEVGEAVFMGQANKMQTMASMLAANHIPNKTHSCKPIIHF